MYYRKYLSLVLLLASAGSPAEVPRSQYGKFDGNASKRSDPTIYSIRIVSVDGQFHPDLPTTLRLKPGFHLLQVASDKRGRRGGVTHQSLPIDIEPCTTHRFVAQHSKHFSNREWSIVAIDKKLRSGCEPVEAHADQD